MVEYVRRDSLESAREGLTRQIYKSYTEAQKSQGRTPVSYSNFKGRVSKAKAGQQQRLATVKVTPEPTTVSQSQEANLRSAQETKEQFIEAQKQREIIGRQTEFETIEEYDAYLRATDGYDKYYESQEEFEQAGFQGFAVGDIRLIQKSQPAGYIHEVVTDENGNIIRIYEQYNPEEYAIRVLVNDGYTREQAEQYVKQAGRIDREQRKKYGASSLDVGRFTQLGQFAGFETALTHGQAVITQDPRRIKQAYAVDVVDRARYYARLKSPQGAFFTVAEAGVTGGIIGFTAGGGLGATASKLPTKVVTGVKVAGAGLGAGMVGTRYQDALRGDIKAGADVIKGGILFTVSAKSLIKPKTPRFKEGIGYGRSKTVAQIRGLQDNKAGGTFYSESKAYSGGKKVGTLTTKGMWETEHIISERSGIELQNIQMTQGTQRLTVSGEDLIGKFTGAKIYNVFETDVVTAGGTSHQLVPVFTPDKTYFIKNPKGAWSMTLETIQTEKTGGVGVKLASHVSTVDSPIGRYDYYRLAGGEKIGLKKPTIEIDPFGDVKPTFKITSPYAKTQTTGSLTIHGTDYPTTDTGFSPYKPPVPKNYFTDTSTVSKGTGLLAPPKAQQSPIQKPIISPAPQKTLMTTAQKFYKPSLSFSQSFLPALRFTQVGATTTTLLRKQTTAKPKITQLKVPLQLPIPSREPVILQQSQAVQQREIPLNPTPPVSPPVSAGGLGGEYALPIVPLGLGGWGEGRKISLPKRRIEVVRPAKYRASLGGLLTGATTSKKPRGLQTGLAFIRPRYVPKRKSKRGFKL